MTWTIFNEDAVTWAKNYDGMPFHALLCDPPYHLTSIVKRFGKNGSAPAKYGTDGVFSHSSKGFMGQTWDGGDVAFRPETWEAFSRVLYPGAFGMAFSASRNWHRLAVAIEDAGFIIHPSIFAWLQGQGFPKATNISKQVDKSLGLSPIKGKLRTDGRGKDPIKTALRREGDTGIGHADGSRQRYYEELPASEQAEMWKGHRYGLQALKPAVEPIIVFQKPYEGKPLDNIVNTGAGALNIDGSRIPLASGDEYTINTFDDGAKPWGEGAGHKYTSRKIKEDPRLGGKGTWKTDKAAKNVYEGGYAGEDIASSPLGRWTANFILDEATAEVLDEQNEVSRFFYTVSNQIDESDPVYYTAKVSPKERNAGLDGFDKEQRMGTRPNSPDLTGKFPDHDHRENGKNPHPTCKPINLAKYLATILLPPAEYSPRRIVVPFSGVSSEMIGCLLAGWEEVVGIEFDTENNYVEIGKKRLEHWIK